MDQKHCRHCYESIPVQANKCSHCLEFQASKNEVSDKNIEIIKEVIALLGKAFFPIVILVLVFSFKPNLESLLSRANEAEFWGGKFKFSSSSSFSGDLSAYELFYLIDSADHGPGYGGGLNYDYYKEHEPEKIEAIESLAEKGLITRTVAKYEGDNTEYFGESTLKTFATEKGKALLKEMGITF
ncbi:hypothetical protein [Marinobacter sp. PE14]